MSQNDERRNLGTLGWHGITMLLMLVGILLVATEMATKQSTDLNAVSRSYSRRISESDSLSVDVTFEDILKTGTRRSSRLSVSSTPSGIYILNTVSLLSYFSHD
jgi:hypothetical protein